MRSFVFLTLIPGGKIYFEVFGRNGFKFLCSVFAFLPLRQVAVLMAQSQLFYEVVTEGQFRDKMSQIYPFPPPSQGTPELPIFLSFNCKLFLCF